MASITQLCTAMADVLGLSEVNVAFHARMLREAEVLTQGSRGRHAARMTALDAAYLLVAVTISRSARESEATVKTYAALTGRRKKWFDLPAGEPQPPQEFARALAWFIDAAGGHDPADGKFDINVTLRGPNPRAVIQFRTTDGDVLEEEYRPAATTSTEPKSSRWSQPEMPAADLVLTASFTEVTILTLGALIGGRSGEGVR